MEAFGLTPEEDKWTDLELRQTALLAAAKSSSPLLAPEAILNRADLFLRWLKGEDV